MKSRFVHEYITIKTFKNIRCFKLFFWFETLFKRDTYLQCEFFLNFIKLYQNKNSCWNLGCVIFLFFKRSFKRSRCFRRTWFRLDLIFCFLFSGRPFQKTVALAQRWNCSHFTLTMVFYLILGIKSKSFLPTPLPL